MGWRVKISKSKRIEEIVTNDRLSIETAYGMFIYSLILEKGYKNIVEIGTGYGYSTAWILRALNENRKGTLYTFDSVKRSPTVYNEIKMSTKRMRKFICSFNDAEKLLPKKIDLVFHDAGHWFEHVSADLKMVIDRIPIGGAILIHDTVYSKDMGERIKEMFGAMRGWFYQEDKTGCGMGFALRMK